MVLEDNYFQNGFSEPINDFKRNRKDTFIAITLVRNLDQFGVAEIGN